MPSLRINHSSNWNKFKDSTIPVIGGFSSTIFAMFTAGVGYFPIYFLYDFLYDFPVTTPPSAGEIAAPAVRLSLGDTVQADLGRSPEP